MRRQLRYAPGGRALGTGLALMAASCLLGCSADKGFETRDIERADVGSAWPFAAGSGVLACEPGDVPTFTADGHSVGLADPDLTREPWAADATPEAAVRMRDAALALCD